MKFHHVGIFVESIDTGIDEMSKIYDIVQVSKTIEDVLIGVRIVFLKDSSGINYELVAPFGNDSPVTGVLKRGHGFLNHLAYTTNQFDRQLRNLRNLGMIPLGPAKKAVAFNGRRVIFFLTKLNYVVEIIEGPI